MLYLPLLLQRVVLEVKWIITVDCLSLRAVYNKFDETDREKKLFVLHSTR